jgi:hypothetical protein
MVGPYYCRARALIARPGQPALLPFGFGAGVGRLLLWAVKNGALNAGAEALAQPAIQSWRAEAGLPHGAEHAAEAIGTAFLFGAGLDLGVRSAWRGLRRLQGRVPQVGANGQVERWLDPGAGAPEGYVAHGPCRPDRRLPPSRGPKFDRWRQRRRPSSWEARARNGPGRGW